MKHFIFILALSFSTLFSINAQEQSAKFSIEQRKEVEQIVQNFLLKNPEIIMQAVQILQDRQSSLLQEKAVKVIKEESLKVFAAKNPIIGNKDGTVYIVEFLDYNCPHCRHISETLNQLVTENKDLKIVIKEFPVLGEASVFAAKAALAAEKQGKFLELHNAFMSEKVVLKNSRVLELAKEVGLNVKLLQNDMEKVEPELVAVKTLASQIGIQATPVLIVATYPLKEDKKVLYIPGAIEKDILQEAINLVK